MRTALTALAATILLVCVFFAGALTAGIRHWFQPVIEISLINDSGQEISDVQLSLETGGQKSISTLGHIEKGQTRIYRFFIAGEGGYILVATLADGRKLTSEAGYAESGYSVKETVTASSIKSEVRFYDF